MKLSISRVFPELLAATPIFICDRSIAGLLKGEDSVIVIVLVCKGIGVDLAGLIVKLVRTDSGAMKTVKSRKYLSIRGILNSLNIFSLGNLSTPLAMGFRSLVWHI